MRWSSGGTSWLEGLSAFGVLATLTAGRVRGWWRRHRAERDDPAAPR